jgi:hypothetical protein
MFRLVFTLAGVVLIGLGAGYFMWGSRVANLTESLNSMVLEQETLRARLATAEPPAPKAASTEGEAAADGTVAPSVVGDVNIATAIGALKDEVQYQAKLIDEQTRLINRMLEASERDGGPALQTCQENMQVLTGQLQRCRADVDGLRSRYGVPSPGTRLPAAPLPPGAATSPPGAATAPPAGDGRRGIPVPPPY